MLIMNKIMANNTRVSNISFTAIVAIIAIIVIIIKTKNIRIIFGKEIKFSIFINNFSLDREVH